MVNFASCRSVYESTRDILKHSDKVRSIAIIAEGVPERRARQIMVEAKEKNVLVIGPATVGMFRMQSYGG